MLTLLTLLALHFVGDFVLQNDWMALNKSKRVDALLAHVAVYSAMFFWSYGWRFTLLTFALHALQDALTSQLTSALWFFRLDALDGCDPPSQAEWRFIPGRRHWFFVAIGFDQFLHAVALAATWWLVFTRMA